MGSIEWRPEVGEIIICIRSDGRVDDGWRVARYEGGRMLIHKDGMYKNPRTETAQAWAHLNG